MKEEDIRPRKIFEEYLRLASEDASLYFGKSTKSAVLCPACGVAGRPAFEKHGFSYEECSACQTIFVSPRPPIGDFFDYYQKSASAKYFATTFYKETAEARREKLWKPRAILVRDVLRKYGADRHRIIDIGGGYGIFAEEYRQLTGTEVTIIEPGPDLARICREKGIDVIESFLESVQPIQLPTGSKAYVSFELFEHLHDCPAFLNSLRCLMQPGDIFLFTTLSGMGVDIQSLWNHSNSFSLQHLNFFNPKSIRKLLENAGLRALSVETPGKLDMDILYNNENFIQDRFLRNLIAQTTRVERQEWQSFIASKGYSSHMFVVCERP